MRAICEDALICDFAQFYHVHDLNQVSIRTGAVLACGLPAESRTVRELTGQKYTTETILKMGILDTLRSIENLYQNVHSKRKIPKPQSVFKLLSRKDDKDIRTFRSGEEFEKERERLLRGTINE